MNFFVAHARLFASVATGLTAAVLVPGLDHIVTRALIGWNVGTWTFLALISVFMVRADHGRLKRVAAAHAQSAGVVLAVMAVATLSTLVAIFYELSAAKLPGGRHALPHVLLALSTVVCSWLLLPTLFTLAYASNYYAKADSEGLHFPESDDTFEPDYGDFAYFAFTIAVALQTADVSITTRPMRRLALLQSMLAFIFNTTILALTVNIAASLF